MLHDSHRPGDETPLGTFSAEVDFAPGEVADLCGLLDGLDLLDRLLALPSEDEALGEVSIGRFRLRRRLGSGRYGVVFLADDPSLRRRVVVKVPQPAVFADPELRARFVREASAAARLDHPGIVPVYDAGEHCGLVYLTAGFVDGPTLAEWIGANPDPCPRAAARLVELLARAVHHAHERGVLHCDLKPANVLLEPPGELGSGVPGVGAPRVTDFGLARLLADEPADDRHRPGGTPLYSAPEQAARPSPNVTQRTDVYALGAILYELVTGRPPHLGSGSSSVLRCVVLEDPVPPRRLRPQVPRDLEAVCLRCLAKDPGGRYATAAELADDLRRFLSGRTVLARRYGLGARAAKWARRRPESAALVLLAAVIVLVGAVDAVREYRETRAHNAELTAALEREREQDRLRKLALDGERAANQWLRLRRYAAAVAQAGDCWRGGRVDLLRGPLSELGPAPGEDDPREFAWHYLSGRVPEQVILRGHADDVCCLAAARTRARLASGSNDGTVVLWDRAAGNRPWELGQFPGPVGTLAFSPSGDRLAAVGADGADGKIIRVWDRTGRLMGERAEPGRGVFVPAFSADGRTLSYLRKSIDNRDEVVAWDLAAGGTSADLVASGKEFEALDNRPDLGLLAVQRSLPEGLVVEQRSARATSLPELRGLPAPARCFTYSPNGAMAAAAALDGTVIAWDARSGAEQFRGKVPADSARELTFSPDGRALALAWGTGSDSRVDWWDVATGRAGEPVRPAFAVRALTFAADRTLALGLADGTVRLWALDPRPPARELIHGAEVWGLAFMPDGQTLATAGDDALVRMWDVKGGYQRSALAGHESLVMAVAVAAGRWLATAGYDYRVRVWDAATGESHVLEPAHAAQVSGVAISPDGRLVASRGRDRLVRVWDRETRKLLRELPGDRGMTGSIEFSPDGTRLVVVAAEHGVQFWDVATGVPAGAIADPDYTWTAAFSPDGKTLATGSANGEVRIYDAVTREPRGVLVGHEGGVRSLAFSPDGKTLASGSDDRTVRLWHAPTAQALLTLRGHQHKVFAVRFSPDGRTLASGSHDGMVRLWQAAD
jgi:WD40 repeat protein/tRNA A-37 threonylcarbamoyl transferase component Bud32